MDLLALFERDHAELRKFTSQMKDYREKDLSVVEQLLFSFEKILNRHTYEEETFLYPKAKQSQTLRPEALEGFEEHRIIGQLFSEMKSLPLSDERWLAKFKVLSETLSHHLAEEEEELFPEARKVLKSEDLQKLAELALNSRTSVNVGANEE